MFDDDVFKHIHINTCVGLYWPWRLNPLPHDNHSYWSWDPLFATEFSPIVGSSKFGYVNIDVTSHYIMRHYFDTRYLMSSRINNHSLLAYDEHASLKNKTAKQGENKWRQFLCTSLKCRMWDSFLAACNTFQWQWHLAALYSSSH